MRLESRLPPRIQNPGFCEKLGFQDSKTPGCKLPRRDVQSPAPALLKSQPTVY